MTGEYLSIETINKISKLEKEIKRLLVENQNLKIENKEYRKKLSLKNRMIRELKEMVGDNNGMCFCGMHETFYKELLEKVKSDNYE